MDFNNYRWCMGFSARLAPAAAGNFYLNETSLSGQGQQGKRRSWRY